MLDINNFTLVEWINDKLNGIDLSLHLYGNNVDLDQPLALSAFEEVTFPGYAPATNSPWQVWLSENQGGPLLISRWLRWAVIDRQPGSFARGVYCVAQQDDIRVVKGAAPFRGPIPVERPGQTLGIRVRIDGISFYTQPAG